jgi:hypothetical protein
VARNIERPGGNTPQQREAALVAVCRLALGAMKIAAPMDDLAEVEHQAAVLYREAQRALNAHRLDHGQRVGDGLPDLDAPTEAAAPR